MLAGCDGRQTEAINGGIRVIDLYSGSYAKLLHEYFNFSSLPFTLNDVLWKGHVKCLCDKVAICQLLPATWRYTKLIYQIWPFKR